MKNIFYSKKFPFNSMQHFERSTNLHTETNNYNAKNKHCSLCSLFDMCLILYIKSHLIYWTLCIYTFSINFIQSYWKQNWDLKCFRKKMKILSAFIIIYILLSKVIYETNFKLCDVKELLSVVQYQYFVIILFENEWLG